MAVNLQEEQLEGSHDTWPFDMFFVKEVGSKFYSLGWEGKLEDVTNGVHIYKNVPKELQFLSQKCSYFLTQNAKYSCEVSAELVLNSHEKGYLVRVISLGEEEFSLLLYFILPLLGLIGGQIQFIYGIIVPVACSLIITYCWSKIQ